MRVRLEYVVIAAGVAAIFVLTMLAGRRPSAPGEWSRELDAGKTTASSPTGTRALYLLLDSQRVPVRRLDRRYEMLPADLGVLVVVAPHDAPDKGETDAVTAWAEQGGTVVLFPAAGARGREFAATLGWNVEAGEKAPLPCLARLGDERYSLKLATQTRVEPRPGILRNARAIAEDELGWAVATGDLGAGRVIAVADPGLAGNGRLGEGDHASFLVHLLLLGARSTTIAFDEYHHGETGGQSLSGYVMSSAAGIAVIQGLAALALFSMSRGRRLGPPRELNDERRRRPQEFIEAFARLCRKAGSRALALDLVLADVRDLVARRHGACDAATIRREAARRGRDGERLASGFEAARRGSVSGSLTTAALLRHQRLLDEIRSLAR